MLIFVNMLYIPDTNTFFVTNYPLYKQAKANVVAVYLLIIWLFGKCFRCHSDNMSIPCFVYPHTNIPRDKSTPGGDTYNTRSERMQYSKYEQEESHLSVPLFSGIKYLRFYSY